MNVLIVGSVIIQFGINSTTFIELIILKIFIELIKFHIIYINIPFLLNLINMNKFKIYYNNIKKIIITKSFFFFIICKFGYLFLL